MNRPIFAIPEELEKHSDIHLEKSKTYSNELHNTEIVLSNLLASEGSVSALGDYVELMQRESFTMANAVNSQIISKYYFTGVLLYNTATDRKTINADAESKAAGGKSKDIVMPQIVQDYIKKTKESNCKS